MASATMIIMKTNDPVMAARRQVRQPLGRGQRRRRPIGRVRSPHAEHAALARDHADVVNRAAGARRKLGGDAGEQRTFHRRAERAILEQEDELVILAAQHVGALHAFHAERPIAFEPRLDRRNIGIWDGQMLRRRAMDQ